MLINPALTELAEIFLTAKAKLFVVGGATRDHFLGLTTSDIDVASALKPEEVSVFLKSKDYEITEYKDFGTVIIKRGSFRVEHTTFRVDSYKNDGSHRPIGITYTTDIKLDAARRDFTVNAIYYDIKDRRFIDFYKGIEDCKNKRLKSIQPMEKTFNEDALRILRYVRFLTKYNFKPDPAVKLIIKKYLPLLSKISTDKIKREIISTLFKTNYFEVQKRAVAALNDFDISKVLFKKHLKFPKSSPLPLSKEEFCLFNNCAFELITAGEKEYKQLKEFLVDISKIINAIVKKVDYSNMKYLAVMNFSSIKKCQQLLKQLHPKQFQSLENIILQIENGSIITSVKKLAITPDEIVKCGILPKNISLVQNILLEKVIKVELRNERRQLIKYILTETGKK